MNKRASIRRAIGALAIAAASLAGAADAHAAFPGENGRLAYSLFDPTGEVETEEVCTSDQNGANKSCFRLNSTTDPAWSPSGTRLAVSDVGYIWTVNPDGTSPAMATNSESDFIPNWSPDQDRIVFVSFRGGNFDLYGVNADGTGEVRLTEDPADDLGGVWSPDGEWIAFWSSRDGNAEIYKMRPDGTEVTRLTSNSAQDMHPDWSPDGAWLTFNSDRDGNSEIYKMRADGTGAVRLTNSAGVDRNPVWSPDGTRIAFISGNDRSISAVGTDGTGPTVLFSLPASAFQAFGSFDWQPIPRGYPRPKGATPLRVPLVPAYRPCAAPNRTHGAPLAFPSCSPPAPEAASVFAGIGDGNPAPAKSIGWVQLKALPGTAPGEDADVSIEASITNVMNTSDRSDHTGALALELPLRITDRFNRPSPSGTGPGTVSDTSVFATVPCTPTADATVGSACALSTTADALLPGAVREGARAIWALGQVKLHAGDELLAVQGVFAP
jgi:hypothetical protein